jgi:hypothetical protein
MSELEALNSFSAQEREAALRRSVAATSAGKSTGTNVNMHMHSFFSYNAFGYSPSRIAYEAVANGLHAAGLCDFDVLDGLDEFHKAGLIAGLRTTVNLETRAFLHEYADVEINSPGEPGVTYIMGCGFACVPEPGSSSGRGLQSFRDKARERNIELVARVNTQLPSIAIDYDTDVLPLTPAGVATERHIVRAYIEQALRQLNEPEARAFWSAQLGLSAQELEDIMQTPVLDEKVRARLAKKGGLGYTQPTAETFPAVDDFIDWVQSCQAIPTVTWLDGTTAGESNAPAMMELLHGKGAVALNIIPDRNWNLLEPDRTEKVARLGEIVKMADAMQMPINIGTEMNKPGLPFADDLNGEALRPFADSFLAGAQIMVGHGLLLRYADFSYVSEAANNTFKNAGEKNAFFQAVGSHPALSEEDAVALLDVGHEKAFDQLADSRAPFPDRSRR